MSDDGAQVGRKRSITDAVMTRLAELQADALRSHSVRSSSHAVQQLQILRSGLDGTTADEFDTEVDDGIGASSSIYASLSDGPAAAEMRAALSATSVPTHDPSATGPSFDRGGAGRRRGQDPARAQGATGGGPSKQAGYQVPQSTRMQFLKAEYEAMQMGSERTVRFMQARAMGQDYRHTLDFNLKVIELQMREEQLSLLTRIAAALEKNSCVSAAAGTASSSFSSVAAASSSEGSSSAGRRVGTASRFGVPGLFCLCGMPQYTASQLFPVNHAAHCPSQAQESPVHESMLSASAGAAEEDFLFDVTGARINSTIELATKAYRHLPPSGFAQALAAHAIAVHEEHVSRGRSNVAASAPFAASSAAVSSSAASEAADSSAAAASASEPLAVPSRAAGRAPDARGKHHPKKPARPTATVGSKRKRQPAGVPPVVPQQLRVSAHATPKKRCTTPADAATSPAVATGSGAATTSAKKTVHFKTSSC